MIFELFERLLSRIRSDLRSGFIPFRIRKIRIGIDTTQHVLDRLGLPTMRWQEHAGVTWEYACLSAVSKNYMIDFDPEGRVRRIRQVVTETNFARIARGMDKDDVRRMLGKPTHEIHYSLKNEDVWDWKIATTTGPYAYFNVHFDANGQVYTTSRTVDTQP